MGYFTYKNKKCYYEEMGEGPILIALHGNACSLKMFMENIADLYVDKFHVIAIDFLGHGKSDRLEEFETDFWYDQGMQVLAFLEQRDIHNAILFGGSGGALAALNAVLECPERIAKVIADSFEGEVPLESYVGNVVQEREESKKDEGARGFFRYMYGEDWESIVDNDTKMTLKHAKKIGKFFHKPLSEIEVPVLLLGTNEDEFVGSGYYKELFPKLKEKISDCRYHIFEHGEHCTMFSNAEEVAEIVKRFVED